MENVDKNSNRKFDVSLDGTLLSHETNLNAYVLAPAVGIWRVYSTLYHNWSQTVNDSQTENDPQNGPQMIFDRNWSQLSTTNDQERKLRMAWT